MIKQVVYTLQVGLQINIVFYNYNYLYATLRELCQLRDNLYSCAIYIDMTDITAMPYDVCTE